MAFGLALWILCVACVAFGVFLLPLFFLGFLLRLCVLLLSSSLALSFRLCLLPRLCCLCLSLSFLVFVDRFAFLLKCEFLLTN